jgi:PPOX class probable F420-dependent enzyme
VELACGRNWAALSTLLPNGHPQTHVMWVSVAGQHLLLNTEVHRQKFRNIDRDPRVTVMIWDGGNPSRFVEVRGEVVEKVRGPQARKHIDELSHKYRGVPYGAPIQSERVILRVAPLCQLVRIPDVGATAQHKEILSSQDIEAYVDEGKLIVNVRKENIQACSYDLRIGTIFKDGQIISNEQRKSFRQ